MLYLVPIEPLEERYSKDWLDWFPKELQKICKGKSVSVIHGKQLSPTIRQGAFLDVIDTNRYKATQLQAIMDLFDAGKVKNNDIFLFLDGWFPGVESLAYVRDALKIEFKIAACFHAGSYDEYDRVYQWGMRPWAKYLEEAWFTIYDLIFVATHFHKDLITNPFTKNDKDYIKVTGFPLYVNWTIDPYIIKCNTVIFPHRLDPEKNPGAFDDLKKSMEDRPYYLLRTKDVAYTKESYYRALQEGKVAISFSDQETWGIAMQEAVLCGCLPLVPDRLSYPELYLPEFIYTDEDQLPAIIDDFILNYKEYCMLLKAQQEMILFRGMRAIPNMVKEMRKIGANI
jgi:hypothetical protein